MDAIQVTRDEEVAIVTFANAEKMNSFDPAIIAHLRETFRLLIADDGVRAMVLTGEGKAFSAGADVGEFKKHIAAGTITQFILDATAQLHPLMVMLHQCDKPLIAAVNGVAAGGGLGLALVADARIGAPEARFAAGYFGIGASPDGGSTWLMPRLIGVQRTRRFFFENQVLGADDALACGLLDELVPENLLAASVALAKRWGAWSPHSRGSTKRLLDAQHSTDFETQLDLERGLIAAAGGTAAFAEGVAAFHERRKPNFA
jgi:2-(1,2-epoxy-1,2-dihydrophenyl)acetyl-CoA isomerase